MIRSLFHFTKEKDYLHPLILWLALLLWYMIFAEAFFSTPRIRLQNVITDQSFWFFHQKPKEAEKITIVAIDERSRRHLNKKWPWERHLTAKLVRNIASYGPKVIALDIVFSGKSEQAEDQALISAFKTHPSVVLGYVLRKNGEQKVLQDFMDAGVALGFVNKPTRAGIVDRTRTYHVFHHKELALSLETEIFLRYLNADKARLRASRKGLFLDHELLVPSPGGIMPLNYLVHPSRFNTVPASVVLEGKTNPDDFHNKIILVGVTDPLAHDEFPTPMGVWPGVTIIGNSLVMMLGKRFVYTASQSQNLLFALILGYLILLLNRRPKFLLNTALTTLLLGLTFFSFLFLRARDIQFSYLAIVFSGTMAYLIPNVYKYLNLLYLTNRLKTLAITDPLTGFYAPRFFLLQLDHRLKSQGDFVFVGMRIKNYRELTLRLNFEQIKELTARFSQYLHSGVRDRFGKALFSRLSNETFAFVTEESRAGETRSFLRDFLEKAQGLEWNLPGKNREITLQGCLIVRSGGQTGTSNDLVYQMESLFERTKEDQILSENLLETGMEEKKLRDTDILEFIAYDWEEKNKDLEKGLKEILIANRRLDELNWGTLKALARAIDANSEWTAGHSERVTELALSLGRILGLSRKDMDNLHRAALLHDIGKIGTPAVLIDKSEPLTEEEYRLVREHPVIGARILEPIEPYAEVLPIVRQHHEWFNGEGYPDGLAGEAITLGARILAVADVYDALSSQRPYRPAMTPEEALGVIRERSGTHFDPHIVEAFVRVAAEKERVV
jgi:putative nucleotidyltransferase with HDIG domain